MSDWPPTPTPGAIPVGGRLFVSQGALKIEGLGNNQQVRVPIDQVDAVVGNPPYIRQEDIDHLLACCGGIPASM